MKQAVKLPTLEELVALLNEEGYWKAQHKEQKLSRGLLALKQASGSLASLAETATNWHTPTAFYTPRTFLIELYTLIIAVHQNDAKALSLHTKIKFKIRLWNGEQQLRLAIKSQNTALQSKAYLQLGLLCQQVSAEMRHQTAFDYFTKVITLGIPEDAPLALRRRAELYLERGIEDLGLSDLQTSCRLAPDNPRAQVEYGRALIAAGRYADAEAAAREALRVDANYSLARDLLQVSQRHLPLPEFKIEADNKHQARDALHADYLKQLSSTPDARRDGFRQLIQALNRCKNPKGEIIFLTELMSEENFKKLLINAPECLADEMPTHSTKLQADCDEQLQKQVTQGFEDCLILYLATQLPAIREDYTQDYIAFYQNISQVLAQKGYYYQDISAKNTDTPIDALDYGLLGHSNSVLDYYAGGAYQILVEYHYQQGVELLQAAEQTLKDLYTAITDADVKKVERFLEQFDLLLKIGKTGFQYPHPLMKILQKKHHDYLSGDPLLTVFSNVFKFKLKHHQTDLRLLQNECTPLLTGIDLWSQYALDNATKALRAFNAYLDERLSTNRFYDTAKMQTNTLLLRFTKSQPLSEIVPQTLPDLTRLVQDTLKRFFTLLSTINHDLNRPIQALQKQISEEAQVILTSLLSTIENILGEAPCAFSLLGLGSYSRIEMSLCSDIDFAILVMDESCVHYPYFKSFLSLLVHLRRGLPSNVLIIESKDLQTLFGQEKSLMHTPREMVREHCPLYTEAELKTQQDQLTNTESYSVRRARLIYNSQTQPQESKTLYEDYQSQLTEQLQARDESQTPYYQRVGHLCFKEDFKKQTGVEVVDGTPKQGQAINLKKTHLRPLTLWLLDVATYFGITENNTWAILEALKQQSRIAPIFLQELEEALTTLHTLRLKLHQAWLNSLPTEPRPSGLPVQPRPPALRFDEWFMMPAVDPVFAHDFYLDRDQQESLDAIQRRMIEPLTETVAVFGATPPAPQFDPIVHYFEQQFQTLETSEALDQKHIVESRLKTLSTLAEIALRRPHLLTPSPAFRDLLPQIKIAYLDALEVALEAVKQGGSTKEIAELKTLVQTLWHYPTEDGWRAESFRQERAWHQQLRCLVSAEVPTPASNTLSLVQGNTLKHYAIKPEIASQLFTAQGKWQLKDQKISGNHLVYKIMDENQTETLCWAKVYPEQPGIEWLMHHLDQRLGVYGIPCSTLVNIHHNKRNSAVLLSAHVPHPNLLETLQCSPQSLAHLDHAHFFKTLMRVLLTNPEDDKGNDYFLEGDKDGLKLIRIDNERAFFAPESVAGMWQVRTLQVKSILYCLDLLMEPIRTGNPSVDAAVQDFLQLKPFAVLKNLLLELKALQPLWQALFSEADIERHYHNKKPWLSLPILYVPQELVKELSVRMESLQTLLVLTPKSTGLALLETVQPTLAKHYLQGFRQYPSQKPYSQVLARFDSSPGQHYKRQGQDLFSLHGTEAVTQSLRLSTALSLKIVKSIWQGKTYAADVVLQQIEHWEADRSKEVYNGLLHPNPAIQKIAEAKWQQLPNRQRALLFNDFSAWVRKNAAANIPAQQALLAVLPNTTFHTLDLSAFHASLDDKLLTLILKTGSGYLIELTLNGCQNLSDAIPGVIAENCPNLKILNVSNMTWKTFSTGLRGWSPILLLKIERLEMKNCQALEYFIVEAPEADINLQGCTALKHMQFSPYPSATNSAEQPGEFQFQLAKSYLLGTGISKNLNHAYYWAQISLKHRHPFHRMLFYILFNFYNVAPINVHAEDVEADVGVSVSKKLFDSIQTNIKTGIRTLELQGIYSLKDATLLSLVFGTLRSLSLWDNNIGDAGALALSESLRVNDTLRHLDLWNNKIGDTGMRALSESLKTNSTLQHLNLMQNDIRNPGAEALSACLKVNDTLQRVDLEHNKIGDKGALALMDGLKENSTLLHCNISF